MADLKVSVGLGDSEVKVEQAVAPNTENPPASSQPAEAPVTTTTTVTTTTAATTSPAANEPTAESQPLAKEKTKETQPNEKESDQIQTQPTETGPQEPSMLAELSVSYFANEQKTAMAWLLFISIYWSFVMWIPTLIRFDFATPGFGLYCIGLIAVFAEGASLYGGYYPSGATKEAPKSYTGRGRLSAIFLVVVILVDLFTLAYIVLNRETRLDEYFRAFCHFAALMWCSLFYYNRLLKENPDMAWTVFWEEWIDIILTIIMIVILHDAYTDKYESARNACFESGLCSTYWSVFIIQLSGWMLPMMTIEGWGAEKHATKVSLHLFALDLCTNVPILIAVVATTGYSVSPAIFFDILWKAAGFIRSTSYFMVYYVWLKTGKRKHEPVVSKDGTKQPQQTQAQAQANKTVKPTF